MDTDVAITIETPQEFSDFLLDELGRWVASGCPIIWKARRFKTSLFPFLYSGEIKQTPLAINFTKNGYLVLKIRKPQTLTWLVSRFNVANPLLSEDLTNCFARLQEEDLSDFITWSDAKGQWARSV